MNQNSLVKMISRVILCHVPEPSDISIKSYLKTSFTRFHGTTIISPILFPNYTIFDINLITKYNSQWIFQYFTIRNWECIDLKSVRQITIYVLIVEEMTYIKTHHVVMDIRIIIFQIIF